MIDGSGTPQAFENMLRGRCAGLRAPSADRALLVGHQKFIKSPFSKPLGWPERSPMVVSTLSSYRFLTLSRKFWTPAFREKLLALEAAEACFHSR